VRGLRGGALLVGAIAMVGIGAVACSDDGSSAADECGSGDTIVEIKDNTFDPETVEIEAGTTVCWPNEGRNEHNVKPDEGDLFGTDSIDPGEAYTYTFEDPGTYAYYCSFHGAPGRGQIGEVIVEGAAATSSTSSSTSSLSPSTSTSSSTSSTSTSSSTSTTSSTDVNGNDD